MVLVCLELLGLPLGAFSMSWKDFEKQCVTFELLATVARSLTFDGTTGEDGPRAVHHLPKPRLGMKTCGLSIIELPRSVLRVKGESTPTYEVALPNDECGVFLQAPMASSFDGVGPRVLFQCKYTTKDDSATTCVVAEELEKAGFFVPPQAPSAPTFEETPADADDHKKASIAANNKKKSQAHVQRLVAFEKALEASDAAKALLVILQQRWSNQDDANPMQRHPFSCAGHKIDSTLGNRLMYPLGDLTWKWQPIELNIFRTIRDASTSTGYSPVLMQPPQTKSSETTTDYSAPILSHSVETVRDVAPVENVVEFRFFLATSAIKLRCGETFVSVVPSKMKNIVHLEHHVLFNFVRNEEKSWVADQFDSGHLCKEASEMANMLDVKLPFERIVVTVCCAQPKGSSTNPPTTKVPARTPRTTTGPESNDGVKKHRGESRD